MEISNIRSISEAELVNFCRAGRKSAWNEFFRRYTNLIKRQIIKVFVSRQHLDLARNPDVVRDIYLMIFDKLYFPKKINRTVLPSFFLILIFKFSFSII